MVSVIRFDPTVHGDDVYRLLREYDGEFVPSISEWSPETHPDVADVVDGSADGIEGYYEYCLARDGLVAVTPSNGVVGFMVYVDDYRYAHSQAYTPCAYLAFIVIEDSYRKNGVGGSLLDRFETEVAPALSVDYVTVRTWSTNAASQTLLADHGFVRVDAEYDVRYQGVHALYYAKPVE